MGLETANFIDGLDKTWPTGVDPVNKGDDHIRLLKNVIKNTFPGLNLNGFNKAINATEDELNFIVGLRSLVQDQIDADVANISANTAAIAANTANIIPAGTLMLFQQTAAPTGWTKQTTHNNKSLRIVSGTAGTGGSRSFTAAFSNQNVGNTTLTTAQMPAHTHGAMWSDPLAFTAPDGGGAAFRATTNVSDSVGGGGSHNHNINLAVQYVDVIIAVKD